MIQRIFSNLKRVIVLIAALVVAFGVFMGMVTTSHAEADYHWLDTFSSNVGSLSGTVTAFDFAPSGNLYVGGDFTSAGTYENGDPQIVNGIAMWDGIKWHPLGDGFGLQFGGILPSVSKIIAVSDTEVYISGFFAYIVTGDGQCPEACIAVRGLAKWNGVTWSGFGPNANNLGVSNPTYAQVGDMEYYNGELWITGLFLFAGGTEAHGIAKWNGSAFEAVAFDDNHGMANNGYGNALATDGTTLYIGGSFDEVGDVPAANIVKYTPDGGFQSLGAGLPGVNVNAIVVDGADVYAAGNANDVESSGGLWRYDGTSWALVGNGVWANNYNGTSGQVYELFLDGDHLYVAGVFGRVDLDTIAVNLAVWNISTETWSQFGNPTGYPTVGVLAVTKKDAQIFVGGGFSEIGAVYIQDGEDFTYHPGIPSIALGIYDPNALPPPAEANLGMYIDLSDTAVDTGQEVDVCLQIYNNGPDQATGVTLTTGVPSGAVLTSVLSDECNSGGGGGDGRNLGRVNGLAFPNLSPNCTAPNLGESGAIVCTIQELEQHDSTLVHFTVEINAAPRAELEFTASITGAELDPSSGNNSAADTVRVRPDLVYVSADGDCGSNAPCYSYPSDAFGELAHGGTLHLLPGEYYESLYLYDNKTVYATGDIILHGQLYLNEGTFHSTAGTLQVRSSLVNNAGTFHHNNGTVFLNGSGYQNIEGSFEFFNLIIGSETYINTQGVPLSVTGSLTNNGTIYHIPVAQYVATNVPTFFEDGTKQQTVLLTSTGANELGDTYVTVSMSEEPPACGSNPFPALAILRHFDISPSGYEGIQATLRLYYDAGELNGVNPSTVGIYHCGYNPETGEYVWELLPSATGPNGSYYVETENVTSFSPFALGGLSAAPTGTTLASAHAKLHKKGGVAVKWETGTEMHVVGFNVLRSNKADGNYKPVNKNLRPAKNGGQILGSKYTLRDKQAKVGKEYYYKIQVLKADGSSEWSEPIHIEVK